MPAFGGLGGGGILLGALPVSGSTFLEIALSKAAVLSDNYFTAIVSNSTFSDNSAGMGGGISSSGGLDRVLTVSNSTLSGNRADYNGGGIYNDYSTVTLANTIVANSPVGGNCSGTIADGGGNLSYPDITCPGINRDPVLGPLQNNGGPTETMGLGPGSAALDAGNDATCVAPPVDNLDQRGIPRPWGPHCDIGAVEQRIVSVCDEAHLRAALASGGTVTFACSSTITLTAEVLIVAYTTIDGNGQTVTISGNNAVRVFTVYSGETLNLNKLTIANGNADYGGGIDNLGTLYVSNGTFSGNSADSAAVSSTTLVVRLA